MLEAMDVIDQLPDFMTVSNPVKSAIFQPKRVSLNSSDDTTNIYNYSNFVSRSLDPLQFSNFQITLKRPILGAKSLQLLRATIPTAIPSLPDGECVFWYYRMLETLVTWTGTETIQGTLAELCYVRLCPSFYPPSFIGTQYGYNRTFQGYQDLVNELNKAAQADPGTNPNTSYPRYYANDVVFGYDSVQNKITLLGTNAAYYYEPVAYLDPNLTNPVMLSNFATYTKPAAPVFYNNSFYSQPIKTGRTLNLRLGWTYSNYNLNITSANLCIGGEGTGFTNYANSYGNLVYTQDVYVYLDFILGGTLDSTGNGNLLSVIPLATSNLGVAFYNNILSNPITQLPDTLSEIQVRLFTDTGDPFYLPNSAIVNLEIGFLY